MFKSTLAFLFLFGFLLLLGCDNKETPFYTTLELLEHKMSKKQLEDFAATDEQRPVYGEKFRWLNQLSYDLFTNKKDSAIIVYFRSEGISKINDMSDIVFTSLHRRLNAKDIRLKEQIKRKKDFYKAVTDCEKLQEINLTRNDKFIEGDTIQIRMKINPRDNCAYITECLNMQKDWIFDDNKDLLITGISLDKYTYDDVPKLVYMKVKVISLNKENIPAPRRLLKPGDEYSAVLNYEIIEYAGKISRKAQP